MNKMPENAPVPGRYKHYKGPEYQVLGMARHSETEEWLVVYQALYGERGTWVRPLTLWQEPAIVKGMDVERFSLTKASGTGLGNALD